MKISRINVSSHNRRVNSIFRRPTGRRLSILPGNCDQIRIKNSTLILSLVLILLGPVTHGHATEPASTIPIDAIYTGLFGGGTTLTGGPLSQEGTSFYPERRAGPLAVNAKGVFNPTSAWLIGGHVGYQWPARALHHVQPTWAVAPATELEGYYLSGLTIRGDDLNNSTARLTEHYFRVTYPTHTGVFLINALLKANHSDLGQFHPYSGVGIGSAVIAISGADSKQTIPFEPRINHYNSGPSDTRLAFAAQPKVGVSFQASPNTNLFIEYRFLYLSATNFMFGSTVYPVHPATSNWDVKIGSQYYNMGTLGIQYDL